MSTQSGSSKSDPALARVLDHFLQISGFEEQAALTLRRALDEVIDGLRTGRWSVNSLEKTEKTYIGTKVEVLFKFNFELDRGHKLDLRVEGQEVDVKCTVLNNWMIPREAVGELCLLVLINDHKSKFSVGLIRADDETLTSGRNRDGKRSISALGKKAIRWLVEDGRLPVNFISQLDSTLRERIFSHKGSGQKRINELFRLVQNQIIPRTAVETVAQQTDPMKRVKDARIALQNEGIIILGHQGNDPEKAGSLGLPVPKKGEFISVSVGD